VVVTILATPPWAATRPRAASAAGRPDVAHAADLGAYRALIRSLLAEAGARRRPALVERVERAQPPGVPQPPARVMRRRRGAAAARRYAQLVRALRSELEAAPGEQHLVLGETAALAASTATTTAAADFARDLPRDVACSAGVWAQHAYVDVRSGLAGARDPGGVVRDVEDALAARHCLAARRGSGSPRPASRPTPAPRAAVRSAAPCASGTPTRTWMRLPVHLPRDNAFPSASRRRPHAAAPGLRGVARRRRRSLDAGAC